MSAIGSLVDVPLEGGGIDHFRTHVTDERVAQAILVALPFCRFGRWIDALGLKEPFDKLVGTYWTLLGDEIVHMRGFAVDDPTAPTSPYANVVHQCIVVRISAHAFNGSQMRNDRNWVVACPIRVVHRLS